MAGKKKKSTTRSGTNLESLSLYNFFLDRALESYLLRDALKALGARVQMHRDHFREDAEDIDWLPVIARREWIVISKDQFNWLERRAIRNAKGRAFLLVRGEQSGQEQASIICKAMPKMLRILDLTPRPFIAKIYRDSSVLTIKDGLIGVLVLAQERHRDCTFVEALLSRRCSFVRRLFSLGLIHWFLLATISAQNPAASPDAAKSVQPSQSEATTSAQSKLRELKISAGTPIEIECAYTVNSLDVRPEDLISFRVLVPIKIDGVTVIEKYSLVTAVVVESKRGRHWGKAGKLSWAVQDVVAADLTRVPLQTQRDPSDLKNVVKGTSHGGQVATQMIVLGALLFPASPLVLMSGFKRGENAILPEGRRFVVFVKSDTVVRVSPESPRQ